VNNISSKIIDDFGSLDLCVFSSGTYDPKLEQEINIKQNKFVMETNFFGVLYCIKSVEKHFKDKKKGHISIVSSVAAYRGLPNSSGYGPSKAALTNLAESLYFDFKKYYVRISLISPGFIKTPLTDKNEFPMPFIKTPEFAAEKMFNGLTKGKAFEIHFPKELTFLLKFLRVLPYRIYLFLIDKFVKR
jgi:short-subunit dehydrogenase